MENKKAVFWEKAKSNDSTVREKLAEYLGRRKASKENLEILLHLLKDKESFVKSAALKSLMLRGENAHFLKALPLLKDKDEVVRVDAVECVAALGKNNAPRYLWRHIDDRSEIVRMFIGTCIGESGNCLYIKRLEKRLEIERSPLAKVGLLDGLCKLGQERRLLELLCLLNQPRYHVRCAVANSAAEIVNRKNKNFIKATLLQVLKYEDARSVISTIKRTLKLIKTI